MTDIIKLYEELAKWISFHSPSGWRKTTINMEIATDGGEIANSWVIKCFDDSGEKTDLDIPGRDKVVMRDIFIELFEAQNPDASKWSVCNFVVYCDGKYEIEYSYGKPPRLSGDLVAGI